MPRYIAIASGYQASSNLRIDVQRADREGHPMSYSAPNQAAAESAARSFLAANLGGAGLELLHLDVIEVAE